jgi:2,3-bisphosphoglycerate-independent phosphoglycerate mutase
LIPSPKVKTYDEKPEMSIFEVKNQIIDIMKSGRENHLIVANIANGDMVGHTGNFTACVQAAKYIDDAIFDLYQEALSNGYTMIITADHGNLEEMVDCNGEIHTQHTTGKVPFILIDKNFSSPENVEFIENGTLANIAPTILKIYGIDKPEEMLQSLFKI